MSILLGDGAGHFSGPTNFDAGISPQSVEVGDFNGDGKQDLAVPTSSQTACRSYWATARGGSALPQPLGLAILVR